MITDIRELLAALKDSRARIRSLIDQTKDYEEDRWQSLRAARTDLTHADAAIDRAETMIQRLIVNGIKPWDVEMAQ
jgi:hypothetical protein